MATITQVFYGCASFFSLIFIWQFVASIFGLSGDEMDVDVDVDADFDIDVADASDGVEAADAAATFEAFRLFSIRAILAFCTLFFWSGAMYLDQGVYTPAALAYASGWGLAGWFVITLLINWMRKLAETGTPRIASCVGTRGSVYMDISADGTGKVRVTVTGAISMIAARSVGDVAMPAGTPIMVTRVLDDSTVEVKVADSDKSDD